MDQVLDVARALWAALDTPVSNDLLLKAGVGDWQSLARANVSPANYTNATDYFKDAVAVSFLRKNEDLPPTSNLHLEAVSNFYRLEARNHLTNYALARHLDMAPLALEDLPLDSFLKRARHWANSILREIPHDLVPRFGKGSTFVDRGEEISIPHKMSHEPVGTAGTVSFMQYLYDSAWGRALVCDKPYNSALLQERGNRFTSVPKDATKNRGICIEPPVNLAFQLDVGQAIRARLKRHAGLDLRTLQDVHRNKAREGSVDGTCATLDLSDASDTISLNLVKLILPEVWFDLLCSLRSPFTEVEGKWVRLEKFSSMGNGYTFELETLIFLSLACACAEQGGIDPSYLVRQGSISVYGDDIIVPVWMADSLCSLLSYVGLTVNPKKSFIEGLFKESCGGDYFDGADVRPYFLKENPKNAQGWFIVANSIRKVQQKFALCGSDVDLSSVRALCLNFVPSSLRHIRGPESLGDAVIHDSRPTWTVKIDRRDESCSSRQILTLCGVPKARLHMSSFSPEIQLAACLYGLPWGLVTRRNDPMEYSCVWFPLLEN